MKKFNLFILILFGISQLGFAQTVTFGDSDFKTYILTLVDAASGGNGDGEVQLTEAAKVDEIFYQNTTWTDHTGLEAFTNLRDLFLDNTTLGSTIDLSVLTGLEQISLANTGISEIELSTITALKSLTIRQNPLLVNLDVSDLSQLRILLANDCSLTNLDLSNNTALERIDVDGNALMNLNLRNGANGILTEMDATDNDQLNCITVDDPTASAGYIEWTKDAITSYDYFCGAPFVTTWETTGDNETITIPTHSGTNYNYYVDWGDGLSSNLQTGNASHEYATADTYTISIYGNFPRIYFNMGGDRLKIQTIEQWGDIEWSSMEVAFFGCLNLTSNAPDAPDLSNVTSIGGIFAFDDSFDGDLSGWDVSTIQNMGSAFYGTALTSDISGWNVSNVTDMAQMFGNVSEFAHDIGGWNVAKVTNMYGMMTNTAAFDHDLSKWKVSLVTDMTLMFDGSGLSLENYMATLDGWAGLSSLQSNVTLGANGLEYCPSSPGRITLEDTYGWTISDDAQGICPFDPATMVQVNDDDFKDYLLLVVDENEDGQVQITEAQAYMGTINYANEGLLDYTGLEYFTNINALNLSGNAFSSIDLTDFELLVTLNLSNGILNSVILPDAPLKQIYLSNNDFESITISGYSTLEQLFLVGNDLTTIDVSNNPSLTRLSINTNEFVNWSDVNISGTTGISLLEVQTNPNLTNLDVSSLSSLTQLYAQATAITELDLSLNTQLTTANISSPGGGALTWVNIKNGNNASLTNFNAANHPGLDCILVDNVSASEEYAGWQKPSTARYTLNCEPILVSASPADGATDFPILGEIRLTFNEPIQLADDLVTGDVGIKPGTIYYDMSDENTLEVIDENTLLIRPYLINNTPRIDNEGAYYLTLASGVVLDMDGNAFAGWTDTESYNFTTESETDAFARYESFSPANDETGVSTELDELVIEVIGLSEVSGGTLRLFEGASTVVKEWDLSAEVDYEIDGDYLRLSDLPDLEPSTLHWVQLIGHRRTWGYTYGSLVTATGEHLQTWGNDRFWEFTTGVGPTVTVNDDDFRIYLQGLVDSDNGGNNDGYIQVSEAESYTGAIIYRNKGLSDATGIEAFVNMNKLDLGVNNLTSIDVTHLTNLTQLNVNVNSLETIDISQNTNLVVLQLAGNDFNEIDLSALSALEVLYLFDTDLTSLDVSDNKQLATLAVQNIPTLTALDLTNNVLIEELEIYSTGIAELDATDLTALTYLDISNTEISFLNLNNQSKLEYLYADNTSLAYLNLKTGNHELIDEVTLTGNPNLTCIEVDNVAYAEANWTDIDEGASYNTECRSEQTITLDAISDKLTTDDSFNVVVSTSSELNVTLAVSGPASIDGKMITLDGTAGTVTIFANQSGDESFQPAIEKSVSFEVEKAAQAISLTAIQDKLTTDEPFDVNATSTSELEVVLMVEGPATIEGNTITLLGSVGTVRVSANQAGNETFKGAEEVSITFEVTEPVVSSVSQTLVVKVYPNPASEWIALDGLSTEAELQLLNTDGLIVIDQTVQARDQIDVAALAKGLYMLRIKENNSYTTTKILIH